MYVWYTYIEFCHLIHGQKTLLLHPKQSETAEAVAFIVAPAKRGKMTWKHARQMTNHSFCITTVAICNALYLLVLHLLLACTKRPTFAKGGACAAIQIALGASRASSRRLKTNQKTAAETSARCADSELWNRETQDQNHHPKILWNASKVPELSGAVQSKPDRMSHSCHACGRIVLGGLLMLSRDASEPELFYSRPCSKPSCWRRKQSAQLLSN